METGYEQTIELEVTPSGIFSALKNKNKGVDHLISAVRKQDKN